MDIKSANISDFNSNPRRIGMRACHRGLVLLLLPFLLYACTSKEGIKDGGTKQDGKTVDQSIKTDVVDQSVSPDQGKNPDLDAGVKPDKQIPDMQIPDKQIPDKQIPDMQIPDKLIPDKQIPDMQIPDKLIPDKQIPDMPIQDMPTPDSGTDTMAPDSGTGTLASCALPHTSALSETFSSGLIGWTFKSLIEHNAKSNPPVVSNGVYTWGASPPSSGGGHQRKLAFKGGSRFAINARVRAPTSTNGYVGVGIFRDNTTGTYSGKEDGFGYYFMWYPALKRLEVLSKEGSKGETLLAKATVPAAKADANWHEIKIVHKMEGTWEAYLDGGQLTLATNIADSRYKSFTYASLFIDGGNNKIFALDNIQICMSCVAASTGEDFQGGLGGWSTKSLIGHSASSSMPQISGGIYNWGTPAPNVGGGHHSTLPKAAAGHRFAIRAKVRGGTNVMGFAGAGIFAGSTTGTFGGAEQGYGYFCSWYPNPAVKNIRVIRIDGAKAGVTLAQAVLTTAQADTNWHDMICLHQLDGTWSIYLDGKELPLSINKADKTYMDFTHWSLFLDGGSTLFALDDVYIETCDKDPTCTPPQPKKCSTYAGSVKGYLDGNLLSAKFDQPREMVFDAAGKMYLADLANNRVRMISAGKVSTVAGDGSKGFLDGPALSARFNVLSGIAMDKAGKIYLADLYNNRVRTLWGGQVSTLAGTGAAGYKNGAAASAQFHYPCAIAVDLAGNVYVADEKNHSVRKIAGGQVTTVATGLNHPCGLAVGITGKVYIGDTQNHQVKVLSGGKVSVVAGTGATGQKDGPAASATFNYPGNLWVDCKNQIWVLDRLNNAVRKISGGSVTTVLGTGGLVTGCTLNQPYDITGDGSGKLYIADESNHLIRVLAP